MQFSVMGLCNFEQFAYGQKDEDLVKGIFR